MEIKKKKKKGRPPGFEPEPRPWEGRMLTTTLRTQLLAKLTCAGDKPPELFFQFQKFNQFFDFIERANDCYSWKVDEDFY